MSHDPYEAPVIRSAKLSRADEAESSPARSDESLFLPTPPRRPQQNQTLSAGQRIELDHLAPIDEPIPRDNSFAFLAVGIGLVLATAGLMLVTLMGGGSDDSGDALLSTQSEDGQSDLRKAAAALAPLSPVSDVPAADSVIETTSSSATPTTVATTTTSVGLIDPPIGPPSEWIDTGHGVLVPDVLLRIRFCESTNNYRSMSKISSARGAYQFLRGSWDWYGHAASSGVAEAHLATPAQQDAAALLTLQRDGTRPWLASRTCWADPNIDPDYRTVAPAPTSTVTTSSTTPVETTTNNPTGPETTSPDTTQPETTAPETTTPETTAPETTAPETTTPETTTPETTTPETSTSTSSTTTVDSGDTNAD